MMSFRSNKQREAEYYGREASKLVKEVEERLKEYYGEEEYKWLYKIVTNLLAVKGLMWSKSLQHRKGAYTTARKIKEEVERWLREI